METRDSIDAGGILEGCNLKISKPSSKAYSISRKTYSQHEFDLNHSSNPSELTWRKKIKNSFGKIKEDNYAIKEIQDFFTGRFPFILILWKYKWKQWFMADLVAGIIVGIMHIPQGMAYSQLTGLKPVYGLYVSFFPTLIYFFLGTSKHISIGTIAIISLMTGKFLEKSLIDYPLEVFEYYNSTTNITITSEKTNEIQMVTRVTGFTLLVGLTQLFMGLLNMGVLTRYLSDPVISGFTVGSSVHVLMSQIKYCFGVKIQTHNGIFNIVKTFSELCHKLNETNIPTLMLTITSMILLIITKEVINPCIIKRIRFPIPMELFVVIASILTSKYLYLNEKHKVLIVGEISKGLPPPTIPDLTHSQNYLMDVVVTAIIGFSVSVSLAKIFSKKHAYKINPNQEFLAYGFMNIFSSFFSCFPSASSLSRSAVQESVGGKTQITSIISSILLVFVLLFIGPLFEKLPSCILASIIIVALKGMFMQFGELKELWLFSIWDFNIWIATCFGTVILDVEYGLIAGVSLSILSIMLRTQNPHSQILGQIEGTDIYKDISAYYKCSEIPGIKIFRYEGSLYYACCDHFRQSLYSKVECDPREIKLFTLRMEKKIKKIERLLNDDKKNVELITKQTFFQKQLENVNKSKMLYIIIDCSTWEYIDIVGMKTLNQVIEEYKAINISVLLANPRTDLRKMFYRIQSADQIDDKIIYLSVHDAVINCVPSCPSYGDAVNEKQ